MAAERPFAACRRAAGLDLHRAAARLRVSETHLRRLERGHCPVPELLARKMAAEYGVPLQQLFSRPSAGVGGSG